MKIAYAYLARNAEVGADAQLYIFGGDFNKVNATAFPAAISEFCVVCRMDLEADEVGATHKLRMDVQIPGGDWVCMSDAVEVKSDKPREHPEIPTEVRLLIRTNLAVDKPGLYKIRLSAGEAEPVVLPLLVSLVPSAE